MQLLANHENPQEFRVYVLKGRLDAASLNSQKTELTNMIEAAGSSIVFNLKQVSFIDSAGLEFLVSANQKLAKHGRRFALCEASGQARLLFELTRLNQVFDLFDSQSMAMAAMQGA